MSAISLDAQGRVRSVDIPTDTVLPAEKTSYDSNEHPNLEDIVDVSEPIKSTLAFSTQTGEKDVVMHRHGGSSVHRFLYTVPHLFTLTEEQITNLNVMVREYSELDIIAQEGTMLSHVFVLASGGVEVINT
ncbi:cyclic nucleotide-binding protein, partial [Trypanosoma grayi]|uniref:cyclic nucleotide-binding protein n=1 Tax=Trypanosoma grayi TaxID=71804 RepID=UPI0004F425DE